MRLRLRFSPSPIFALAVVVPITAQAQVVYWCDPVNAPYPQIATCPVPWRAVAPAAATPQPAPLTKAPPWLPRPDPYDINHSNSKG